MQPDLFEVKPQPECADSFRWHDLAHRLLAYDARLLPGRGMSVNVAVGGFDGSLVVTLTFDDPGILRHPQTLKDSAEMALNAVFKDAISAYDAFEALPRSMRDMKGGCVE